MKKLILLAVAVVGGLLVYRQFRSEKSTQDLWAEASDTVPGAASAS
jgi:hypothetical protein